MERHEYYMELETMEQNMEHRARGETWQEDFHEDWRRDKVQRKTEDLNTRDNEREYLGDRGSKLSAKHMRRTMKIKQEGGQEWKRWDKQRDMTEMSHRKTHIDSDWLNTGNRGWRQTRLRRHRTRMRDWANRNEQDSSLTSQRETNNYNREPHTQGRATSTLMHNNKILNDNKYKIQKLKIKDSKLENS